MQICGYTKMRGYKDTGAGMAGDRRPVVPHNQRLQPRRMREAAYPHFTEVKEKGQCAVLQNPHCGGRNFSQTAWI